MASLRELREEIKEGIQEQKSVTRGLNHGKRSLVAAIRARDVERVQHLLDKGVDPNFRDASGDYPIHLACRLENACPASLTILETLLYMGADHEVQNRFSRLPLHVAAAHSHDTVKVLLDKGCSINAQDNAGCTALMEACRNNRSDPVETSALLIQRNCNVHLEDDTGYTGRMPLCLEVDKFLHLSYRALPRMSLQLVETLMSAGANIQPHSRNHQQWARSAAITAHPQVLSALVEVAGPVLTRPAVRLLYKALVGWSVSRDITDWDADDGHLQLQAQLQSLSHSVHSLRAICRLSIRAQLRGKLLVYVPMLPIPNSLQEYLISLDQR
ncbi:hypothetical protein BaRGS_00006134 [Batillaria attramentaria]|uniref:SOCS box domain-containing protein n=1 Tax=Batillaria attramentaria TaxID=370345 RepID=A0ABD0LSM5_9CAEN